MIPGGIGLETNLAGYDVASVKSANDNAFFCIEVKTTTTLEDSARFWLTRHEWETALSVSNYAIYLWILDESPKPTPKIVSPSALAEHIPVDQGDGAWESTRVRFSSFCT